MALIAGSSLPICLFKVVLVPIPALFAIGFFSKALIAGKQTARMASDGYVREHKACSYVHRPC